MILSNQKPCHVFSWPGKTFPSSWSGSSTLPLHTICGLIPLSLVQEPRAGHWTRQGAAGGAEGKWYATIQNFT